MPRKTFMLLVAVTLILACQIYGEDEFEFPETRGGEIARDYFEAYNSNDLDRLRQHYETYRSEASLAQRTAEERAKRTLDLYGQVGPLTPVKVTAETDFTITITARAEKAGMWISCAFQLEEVEPHKLSMLMIGPGSPPETETEAEVEWDSLADLLNQIREGSKIPAIAAAVVENGELVESAAVGVRQTGTSDSVQTDDRFHIGSVTKSVTATMIGALVEKGILAWDTIVSEVLTDVPMRDEYRDVTLEQLLQHRGGIPAYMTMDDSTGARLIALPGSPTEQRGAFVAEVLQAEPVARPGKEMIYSNAGYSVAALMAERASGTAWRELVSRHVLRPHALEEMDFGWPATESRPDQPRGHYYGGAEPRVQGLSEYPLGEFLAPAGDMHASIGALARYAGIHLEGLAGHDGALRAATIRRLHTPPESAEGEMAYAAGWAIVEKQGLGTVHTHSGSAGTFFVTVELYPREGRAIVVAANSGAAAGAVERIIRAINDRLLAEDQDR